MSKHNPHNKNKVTSIVYLMRALRAGREPQDLGGKEIGAGVCKSAYFFDSPAGGYVVKLNAQCGFGAVEQRMPPVWIKAHGARGCRTYKAGKYIIQELVTVLSKIPDYVNTPAGKVWRTIYTDRSHGHHDMHEHNVGVDSKGQLVVFDW